MDIQRLRTLTTGKGHTDYLDLQEDITRILGPIRQDRVAACALKAMKPWLQSAVPEEEFWDGVYNPNHRGEYYLPSPTDSERAKIVDDFLSLLRLEMRNNLGFNLAQWEQNR